VNRPQTRYAKTADGLHIAYQAFGSGPVDIVIVMGWTSNIEALWEEPGIDRFLTDLSRHGRTILFDKRGTGLSDRVPDDRLPSLEVRMDDARAVMDAAGSQRAVVFGISEGGPMATLFAATYPDRTIGLALFGTAACWKPAPDYPFPVSTDEEHLAGLDDMDRRWGTVEFAAEQIASWGAPSLAGDERLADWLADYMRRSASPGAAMALSRMNRGIDARAALPAVHVPTLVLARRGDPDFPVAETRWMADHIPGAEFRELDGDDHFFWVGDQRSIIDAVGRFVAEVRDAEAALDRVLGTVLFTDIVGSTDRAVAIGDRAWSELVERHHRTVRALLARFRGTEIDTAGDGFFATFDGPARAVRCAQAIRDAIRDAGLEIRAGVHTGELESNAGRVGGIAVNIGARIGALSAPSEVLVSSTVRDLVSGSGIVFEDAGEHRLKGLPEPWHLYRAVG
jgi:class 3 adenylate cyclase